MVQGASPEGAARKLSKRWRTWLRDSFRVGLSCQVALSRADADPEGAVDYALTFEVSLPVEDMQECSVRDRKALSWLLGNRNQEAEAGTPTIQVGHGHVVLCDLGDPSLWSVLDDREGDLEHIASAVLDPSTGELSDDLYEVIDGGLGHRLVIVNDVHVFPQWRGLSFGLLGTGLALQHLAPGSSCAALYPMEPGTEGEAERAASHARLSAYWGQLGFEPFRDGVHVLDLALITLDEAMTALGAGC